MTRRAVTALESSYRGYGFTNRQARTTLPMLCDSGLLLAAPPTFRRAQHVMSFAPLLQDLRSKGKKKVIKAVSEIFVDVQMSEAPTRFT